MDNQGETVYSAKQVARELGVSLGMLRRYAAAYEELTGGPISQHPRDGRRYTGLQLQQLLTAKQLVRDHAISIDVALKMALGMGEVEALTGPVPPPALGPAQDSAELARALSAPLRSELEGLRGQGSEQLEELRRIRVALEALAAREERPGPLARLLAWWEGRRSN